ncbi:MAG: serine--tRNA ligase [Candidatus Methylacidiphilales bacterium]|nr:serine--tRNA ligase [Candidatus Methylacidiphilales bacterium]
MLDIKIIRDQPDEARRRLATRGRGDEARITDVLEQDRLRRATLNTLESSRSERKKMSGAINGRVMKLYNEALKQGKTEAITDFDERVRKFGTPEDVAAVARMAEMKIEQEELERCLVEIDAARDALLLTIPNYPHESVPVGEDEKANRTERTWGEKPSFPADFTPQPHWVLAEKLGMLDLARATKISGSGFIVFKGNGARLERVLLQYLLDVHTRDHGYTEVSTPFVVRRDCMVGTGQLPKFEDDMYAVKDEDLFLIPTAEVPVTNMHRDEILREEELPIRYAAYTPCFRREAGSAGKDTRGMIRVHQFDKVELVHIVKPEESYATLETLVGHAERILQDFGLHYRVLCLSTGDMGFGAAKCYDIEVWAPGLGTWLEVSSCSNFEDFQARRMNLRYKDKDGKNVPCHTLNGSGTALARLFIALLETYQRPDGSILLPEKLRPYFGSDIIPPPSSV